MATLTKPTKRHLYWHFASADRRLGYGDDREIVVGETLTVTPPVKLCKHGLHASYRVIDALWLSAGPIICRVRLGGDFCAGTDKVVASERTVLAMADATDVLHEFACWCAERALTAANVTDPRPWRAIEVKRLWLAGVATEEELAAAMKAARLAASDAARAAARAAERAAERAAAGAAWAAASAAWAAASAAARAAASSAASAAASAAASWAASLAQNAHLEKELKRLLAK